MRNSILALAAAAATLTGVAYAQQPPAQQTPAPPPPRGDPFGAETISRADAQTRANAMFDRFDLNHDGKLDQADRAARVTAMFDQIDGNHDGTITRDEFATAHERMGGPMGRHKGSKGPGHGPGGDDHAGMGHGRMGRGAMPPPPPPPGTGAREPLSRDAFVAEAMKRFDAADSNHDGKVTAQERRMAMRGRHGRMDRGGRPGADMPPPTPGMGS